MIEEIVKIFVSLEQRNFSPSVHFAGRNRSGCCEPNRVIMDVFQVSIMCDQ